MMLKSQIFIGDLEKKGKKSLNYCLQAGAVVKDGAMIKHNLDQTATLFHILAHLQSRTD